MCAAMLALPLVARAADEDLERAAREVLAQNRKVALEGVDQFRYTAPDAKKYPFQWLWDSCFHVTAFRWTDPAFAREELESLLAAQWPNGMVPNLVHMDGSGFGLKLARWMQRAGRNTSGITQPPILAETVMRLEAVSPDPAFLARVYPRLVRYYDWIAAERDPRGEGLPAIYHPWESGADDSPRWDPLLGIQQFSRWRYNITKFRLLESFANAGFDGRKVGANPPYVVRGVDMACYLFVNLQAMQALATRLGKADDAARFGQRADVTRRAILARMWNPKIGMFADLLGVEERLSDVVTPFGLLPLYAGIVDHDTARRLADTLKDPQRFGTRFAVPSVAASARSFDPEAYWRGTVWINVSWFLVQGLRRYGMTEDADRLVANTLELVRTGGFREYFNPLTGEGLGAEHFSWTAALVIDLIESRAHGSGSPDPRPSPTRR